jgi:hypothetical protein
MNPTWRARWRAPMSSELVLAGVTTGWAVLLWADPPDASTGTLLSITSAVGGLHVFLWLLTALSVMQWLAVFIAGWPPRLRAGAAFTVFLWWTFVTLVTAIVKWSSVLWVTTAGIVALAFIVWLRLRREILCAKFQTKEGGGAQ